MADEADDAKNAESEAEEDTKNSGKEDTVSEAEENLTVDNCPGISRDALQQSRNRCIIF